MDLHRLLDIQQNTQTHNNNFVDHYTRSSKKAHLKNLKPGATTYIPINKVQ